jgi:tRNA threonylcarbamoyladenosine biosynthesis protein TsaB
MKLLAIDTVTEACSAALWLDGEVQERFEIAPRRHTVLILPMVQELLAEAGMRLAQLDAIAVDRGPGSFTGVRIGTGVVQGLAYAADLPVVPVSSLATLAQAVWLQQGHAHVLALIDARMQEVYGAHYRYQGTEMELVDEERVGEVSAMLSAESTDCYCVGSGSREYAEQLQTHITYHLVTDHELDFPRAGILASLAVSAYARNERFSAAQLEPSYLRNQVVQIKT